MMKKKSLVWQNCSETELKIKIGEWLQDRSPHISLQDTLILLEGEMGSGKSTWVRALLGHLVPTQLSQGSPTFPLVQTYHAAIGAFPIYHIDFYRLKSEHELYDSGIEEQIEEQGALACVEWPSLFPEFFNFWTSESTGLNRKKKVCLVQITPGLADDRRDYHIREI